jgi:hypothetical protein
MIGQQAEAMMLKSPSNNMLLIIFMKQWNFYHALSAKPRRSTRKSDSRKQYAMIEVLNPMLAWIFLSRTFYL